MPKPPTFEHDGLMHQADTCDPLEQAAERGELRLSALGRGDYPGTELPLDAVPQVNSIGYWDADSPQNWGLPLHRNEGIELTFLESGHIDFCLNGVWHSLRPGDLTVTRPWQPHQVGNPTIGAGRLYWIILDVGVRQPHQQWQWPDWLVLSDADLTELTGMLRENEQPIWHATEEVGYCFEQIGRMLDNPVPTLASRLALLISELFICLLETLRSREVEREDQLTSSERSVELFLDSLPETVDASWSLEAMAGAVGLKRTQFTGHFKRLTNMSPMQYLSYLRIEKAKILLVEQSNSNLDEIAALCGFSSGRYLVTAFRKEVGITPGAYRAERRATADSC